MRVGKFTEKTDTLGGVLVYYQGLFVGKYTNIFHPEMTHFMGNKGDISSMNMLLRYMRLKHPDTPLNYTCKNASGQLLLVVACGRIIVDEGIVRTLK